MEGSQQNQSMMFQGANTLPPACSLKCLFSASGSPLSLALWLSRCRALAVLRSVTRQTIKPCFKVRMKRVQQVFAPDTMFVTF